MNTAPPLWAIYLGQVSVMFVTVFCFVLVLKRLNQNLVKTLQANIDLAVQKQELAELAAADLERKRTADALAVSKKVVEAAEGVRDAVVQQAEDVRHKVEEAAEKARPMKVEVVNTPLIVEARETRAEHK